MKDLTISQDKILSLLKYGTEAAVLKTIDCKTGFVLAAVKVFVKKDYSVSITGQDIFDFTSYSDLAETYDRILLFTHDIPAVGYHAGYDFRLLYETARKTENKTIIKCDLDISSMARDLFTKEDTGGFSLDAVSRHLGISVQDEKDIMEQVLLSVNVLEKLLQKYAAYVPPSAVNTKLEKAWPAFNSQTKNIKKISMQLFSIKPGLVYYDAGAGTWYVDESVKDKIFLPEVIRQFYAMYVKPLGFTDINDLLDFWEAYIEDLPAKPKKSAKKKKTA